MLRLLRQLRVNANRNCSAAPSPQATTRDLMQQLSDLSAFSHPQRDELVLPLWSTVWTHTVQVEVQQIPINELQARRHLNSQNSSKLPSSDGPNKPKSFCKARLRPIGGRKGHKGHKGHKGSILAPSGQARRSHHPCATRALRRLPEQTGRDALGRVWHFMNDPGVPLTNQHHRAGSAHAQGRAEDFWLLPVDPRGRHAASSVPAW